MPTRRDSRPSTAKLKWQVEAGPRSALIDRYSLHGGTLHAHDEIFNQYVGTSLEYFMRFPRLVEIEWPPVAPTDGSWRSRYLNALDKLAAETGLERLVQPSRSSASGRTEGHALLHSSFYRRASAAHNDLRFSAGDCIQMSAAIWGSEPDMTPSGSNPPVVVSLESDWNMNSESIHDARERIVRSVAEQINDQLVSSAETAESAGHTFVNQSVNQRDIDLLFWWLTEKLSYQQIATRWNIQNPDSQPINRDSVRKAIQRIATRIGITTG